MDQDLVRTDLRRAGQKPLSRADTDRREAHRSSLGRDGRRRDREVEFPVWVGRGQASVDPDVAAVVKCELGPGA